MDVVHHGSGPFLFKRPVMWAMLGIRAQGSRKTCSGKLRYEPNPAGSALNGSISGRDFPSDSRA